MKTFGDQFTSRREQQVPRTVYLHVGTGKSGTTYLQRVMARNRGLLKKHGVIYPGRRSSHFLASMDLRGSGFKGYDYPATEGAWDALVREVQSFSGNAVVSHETFGRTPPKLVKKAVESFADRDVKVLITCRDIGRQIPASWQERVKNRNDQTYADFLSEVFDGWNDGKTTLRSVFWRTQNLVDLSKRWSGVVGAENVRLVTVPAPGAATDELWKRYAAAADLPDLDYDLDIGTSNASLGTAETELLRRLNPRYPEGLAWPQYEARIKSRLSRQLALHNIGGKLAVPEKYQPRTEELAAYMIDFLRDSGCAVVGDLEELRPSFRSDASLPEDITEEALMELSLQVLAEVSSRGQAAKREISGGEAARVLANKARARLRLGR